MSTYPYKNFEHAVVAVDVVIFTVIEGELKILLLKLQEPPFADKWAVPGGLVKIDESVDEAARRHVWEKAGVKDAYLEQLYTFGEPGRDPSGRVISVAYYALIPCSRLHPRTTSRYADIQLISCSRLPPLGYDHDQIIRTATERLKSKLGYTNIIYSLIPREFTFTELQTMYEIILGRKLDKRNFRRKIKLLGLIKSLGKRRVGESHRPAQVFTFKHRSPQVVEIL